MAISILLINGPNLNLLGTREPERYGHETLSDVEEKAKQTAKDNDAGLTAFQSNWEGAIVDEIQNARGVHDALVINPGAYSHTSIAIRDAILGIGIPVYEIHISDIHKREKFRHHSYISDIAELVVVGEGTSGYTKCIEAAIKDLSNAG